MKMKARAVLFLTIAVLGCLGTSRTQNFSELKLDPLLLSSLEECRNITESLDGKLFPGWQFQEMPVLFYRPGVQELLINFPHRPDGFVDYAGFNPFGQKIYVRNGITKFNIDDQNTSTEIDGVPVLVVADPYSSLRNQLRGVFSRSPEFVNEWLDDWNFVPSPYDRLQLILHEGFHVYQRLRAPNKRANEMAVAQYPLLDPENNALSVLEGKILKDALLARESAVRLEKINEFIAVRTARQARLQKDASEYEHLNEYSEGLAKYIEYKFTKLGEGVEPGENMYYHQGFNGYRDVLSKRFEKAVQNMVNVVAVNDDRFGNKFGAGPLRFKLYELGACQALLLDEVMPSWKETIFGDGVYLTHLLQKVVSLTASEREHYLTQAKQQYGYDAAYNDKLQFQKDGEAFIQNKLSNILETKQTLVKVFYGDVADQIGLGFTPFGVTQVTQRSAIYDLVPISALFEEGKTLQMKQVIPVFIDLDSKLIAFSIASKTTDVEFTAENTIVTNEFTLTGCQADLKRAANTVEIHLK